LYLYLGYLLVHFYSLVVKLSQSDVPISAMIFSVVVVFIWSFLPFIGYCLAKFLKAKGQASNTVLFVLGIGVGLIENSLFYFDVLTTEQSNIGMFIVFILFFSIAYISTNKAELGRSTESS